MDNRPPHVKHIESKDRPFPAAGPSDYNNVQRYNETRFNIVLPRRKYNIASQFDYRF